MTLSSSANDLAIAHVLGKPVSVGYLFNSLRLWRKLSVVDEVIRRFVIESLFEREEITVAEDDVLDYQCQFREDNELFDEDTTSDWLKLHHLTDDDFWQFCEFNAKLEKLKAKTIGDRVEQRFALEKFDLETVELYHIILPTESAAKEIKSLSQEGEDFCVLARNFSTEEETRKQCGYMGLVYRKDLRAEIEAAVFQSAPGDIVGPFRGARGFHLYMVSEIHQPTLDSQTRHMLLDTLFNEYLRTYMTNASIHKFSDLSRE